MNQNIFSHDFGKGIIILILFLHIFNIYHIIHKNNLIQCPKKERKDNDQDKSKNISFVAQQVRKVRELSNALQNNNRITTSTGFR